MSVSIKQGFQRDLVNLAIVELRPTKSLSAQVQHGRKYSQILSSIREVGLIEPPCPFGKPAYLAGIVCAMMWRDCFAPDLTQQAGTQPFSL